MIQPRSSIIHNVHIYLYQNNWYIPTVVKRPDGFWVEMLPVDKIEQKDINNFLIAIQRAQNASIKVSIIEKGWDGDNGKIWQIADLIYYIFWFSDGSIKLAPQFRTNDFIFPDTGQVRRGELRAIKEKIEVFSPGTPLQSILAQVIALN